MENKKRKSFSKQEKMKIVEFWKKTYKGNIDFFYDGGFSDEKLENVLLFEFDGRTQGTCFCCGKKARLQVCHIVPWSISKDDSHSNLFLMCDDCHVESPDFSKREYFFNFVAKKQQFASKLWIEAIEDSREIFGRINFEKISRISEKLGRDKIQEIEIFFDSISEFTNKAYEKIILECYEMSSTHKASRVESTRVAIREEAKKRIIKAVNDFIGNYTRSIDVANKETINGI